MDIERNIRRELIEALSPDFACFEEVPLRHALFQNQTLRADVVAIPIERQFWGHALAFEVKDTSKDRNYAFWSSAIRQAGDYVYAEVQSEHPTLSGRRISAALVYPAPDYYPYIPKIDPPDHPDEAIMISGAFHAAMHFRVGRAHIDVARHLKRLTLYMGPNDFWAQGHGFTGQARPLLLNKRPIGSQRIDVAAALSGLGDGVPFPNFE